MPRCMSLCAAVIFISVYVYQRLRVFLFLGDRIRLILLVFRDITRLPLSIRVDSVPLPFLMWISLNMVDGSPDDLMTVSWLVALRIYIYLLTCLIILAKAYNNYRIILAKAYNPYHHMSDYIG